MSPKRVKNCIFTYSTCAAIKNAAIHFFMAYIFGVYFHGFNAPSRVFYMNDHAHGVNMSRKYKCCFSH